MPAPRALILASGSPRRADLLRAAGYAFWVDPADVDESVHPAGLLPSELAVFLAAAKADRVAARHPTAVTLAADTVVAFGDRAIGKPADAADARSILTLLAGTTHVVITGVSIRRLDPPHAVDARVLSAVRMRFLSPADVETYLATDAWRGKAGGYGIQDETGKDDPFVTKLAGCHTNIVGLPMTTTARLLKDAGIEPTEPPSGATV